MFPEQCHVEKRFRHDVWGWLVTAVGESEGTQGELAHGIGTLEDSRMACWCGDPTKLCQLPVPGAPHPFEGTSHTSLWHCS